MDPHEKYLRERYFFRYNTVRGRLEYVLRAVNEFQDVIDNDLEFKNISDYDLNSITRALRAYGLPMASGSLKNLLMSNFTPKFNPFTSYFEKLGPWQSGRDYISELAGTVETTDNEFWQLALRKWIVAMVASLNDDEIINNSCLILAGRQGLGKTTWIKNLVPPTLKSYYYNGPIFRDDKDSLIQVAENWLINIDEIQSSYGNDISELKGIITIPSISVRRPYAMNHEWLPHRASFAGTTNELQFLFDTTGLRRFLTVTVISMDFRHSIPVDAVYAQALSLLNSGYQYWFNNQDNEFISANNEQYRYRSLEEELLLKWYEPCPEGETPIYLPTTEILNNLLNFESDVRSSRATQSAVKSLAKALRKNGFERLKKKGCWVFALKLRKPADQKFS